ncbi:MAG: BatD family protein [Euryarchaeota archaeon]|nr:BatD family protein [Euryarchaeota archaeon]
MIRKSLLILLVILFSCCNFASAYTLDDIEWVSSIDSTTLHWGDTVTNDDYVVTAEDFNEEGFVHLTIKKNGELVDFASLQVGGSFEYRDEVDGEDVRVYVKGVDPDIDEWNGQEDPTTEIQIYRRGLPELDITIDTDKDTYDPKQVSSPDVITATITVKNNGNAKAEDVEMTIDTNGLELYDGDLTHSFSTLEINEVTDPVVIKLTVPHLWDENDFEIKPIVDCYDINDDLHGFNETKTLTVVEKAKLIITKTITNEVYMGETIHVQVSIRNAGICRINSIEISDSIIEELELMDSVTLAKTISLNAGETQSLFKYSLRPINTGTFTAPAATAIFTASNGKEYEFKSNGPAIEVNGPDIGITQDVNVSTIQPGKEVTVTVTVKNDGNKDASVTVGSTTPDEATFISGDQGFSQVLKGKSSESYTYVIRLYGEGMVKLPAATATFIDMEDYSGEKISNTPVITVVSEEASSEENGDSGSSFQDENDPGSDQDDSSNIYTTGGEQQESGSDTASSDNMVTPGFEPILATLALLCVYMIAKNKK